MSRNNRMSPITADPNGTKFSGGGQASRLLFSLPEGRRDGHPTAHNIETFSTKESRLLYIMGLTRMALS